MMISVEKVVTQQRVEGIQVALWELFITLENMKHEVGHDEFWLQAATSGTVKQRINTEIEQAALMMIELAHGREVRVAQNGWPE
jgi:hypothetical protein